MKSKTKGGESILKCFAKRGLVFLYILLSTLLPAQASEFKISTKEPLKKQMMGKSMDLSVWRDKLNTQGFDLLCLGESHTDFFRNYYSEKILPFISANIFAIESLQEKADLMKLNFVEMLPVPDLLSAPFDRVTDAVLNLNPNADFKGVEITKLEKGKLTKAQIDHISIKKVDNIVSRDSFIAQHISKFLDDGADNIVALYGAKHCAKYSTKGFGFNVPFYRLLSDEYASSKKLIAAHIIKADEHQNPIRIYAKEFGLFKGEDIVIENPGDIDPKDYNYRLDVMNVFKTYDVIILPRR